MDRADITGGQTCLIGHTGFVGSNLLRQFGFSHRFNSQNIERLAEENFDLIVCAAAPGSMFEANRNPDQDRERVHSLIEQLDRSKAKHFALISSIAVLARFDGGDDETTSAFQEELAYGRHRRELEAFVENRFPSHLIVRLPALFGEGLRKNFLFDLINPVPTMLSHEKLDEVRSSLDASLSSFVGELYANEGPTGLPTLDRSALARDSRRGTLEAALIEHGFDAAQFHNRQTTYQYYEVARLCSDIETAFGAGLSHLHCATEPLRACDIYERLTRRPMPETGVRLHREDMHTAHAGEWGRTGPYLADASDVLERVAAFFEDQKVPA